MAVGEWTSPKLLRASGDEPADIGITTRIPSMRKQDGRREICTRSPPSAREEARESVAVGGRVGPTTRTTQGWIRSVVRQSPVPSSPCPASPAERGRNTQRKRRTRKSRNGRLAVSLTTHACHNHVHAKIKWLHTLERLMTERLTNSIFELGGFSLRTPPLFHDLCEQVTSNCASVLHPRRASTRERGLPIKVYERRLPAADTSRRRELAQHVSISSE